MKLKVNNPQFELEAYESFVKDIYDPLEFKKIIPVLKPTKDGYEKVRFEPYPYQKMWTMDKSTLKYAAKSRQIGFSYNEMIDSLHKAITTPNYLKMFISLRAEDANELLTIVKNTVMLMEEEWRIPFTSERDNLIKFENGSRLIALPSKNAGRSRNGDVFIDEIAFIPNDEEMLTSIMQTTVRGGYTVSIGSTPYGQRGEFHRILKQAGWDTSSVWTDPQNGVQKYHIEKFMRDYLKLRAETESDWSIHLTPHWSCPDLDWERIKARAPTNDALLQEYGIAFLDETTSMLPYQLMLDRANVNLKQFSPMRVMNKVEGIRRVGGLDVAERRNQTVLMVFEKIKNKWFKRYKKVWQGEDHTVYNPEIVELFHKWNLDHLYMDGTGIGIPIYADLAKYLTPSQLTSVNLSNSMKIDLVYNLVAMYEAGGKNKNKWLIETDHDVEMFDQLHQLRRNKTKTGKEKFSGKIEGKNDDIIWATSLALYENIEVAYGDFYISEVKYNGNYRSNPYG